MQIDEGEKLWTYLLSTDSAEIRVHQRARVEPGGMERSVRGGLKENVSKPDPTLEDRTLLKYPSMCVIRS